MRNKSVEKYHMKLNGFAYDSIEKDGSKFVRVAHIFHEKERAVFCVVNGRVNLVSSSMSDYALAQVERDLPGNVNLILSGLPEKDLEEPK